MAKSTCPGVYESTIAVIFLGTPHKGSDDATLANIAATVFDWSIPFRRSNRQIVSGLRTNALVLEEISDAFKNACDSLKLYTYYELLPMAINRRPVRATSRIESDQAHIWHTGSLGNLRGYKFSQRDCRSVECESSHYLQVSESARSKLDRGARSDC